MAGGGTRQLAGLRAKFIEQHGHVSTNPCNRCAAADPKSCIVKNDLDFGLGKFKCSACLSLRQSCSFSSQSQYQIDVRLARANGILIDPLASIPAEHSSNRDRNIGRQEPFPTTADRGNIANFKQQALLTIQHSVPVSN